MAICPICGGVSSGKRIAFNGFEVFDLCIQCASFSACLISPKVEIAVKQNAIIWADRAIENNREKIYLANCIRSWKQCAENFIKLHSPACVPVAEGEKTDILDTANYSEATLEENDDCIDVSAFEAEGKDIYSSSSMRESVSFEPETDPEVMPFCVSTEPDNGTISELEEVRPAPAEKEENRLSDEEIEKAAEEFFAEASKNFIEDEPDIKDFLGEILNTLKSIDDRMERIEKEISYILKNSKE